MGVLSETRYRWLVLGCNAVGAACLGVASFYGWSDFTWKAGLLLASGVLALATPPILPLVRTIRRAGLEQRDRALELLTELCALLLGCPSDCNPRVTVLRVNGDYTVSQLNPISRYPGSIPESSMTIQQGIAGLCYRTKKVALQPEIKDFFANMIEFGFTQDEARQFKQDRKTYLCVPVLKVIAVLSCDANKPNVFDDTRVKIAERLTPFFSRLLTINEKVGE